MRIAYLLILAAFSAGCMTRPAASVEPTQTPVSDLQAAADSLNLFFALLNQKQFAKAVEYYGGDYEWLRGMNPDVPAKGFAILLERGCTFNGMQCLSPRNFISAEQVDAETFRFLVEFQNPDGSLFTQVPCCGADETIMPTMTQFPFTVKKTVDKFLVMELPPYLP